MTWNHVKDKLPKDSEYVLVACPYKGVINIKSNLVLLAIYMQSFRDDKGRFSSNGWFNEQTGELIDGVEKWHYIPAGLN